MSRNHRSGRDNALQKTSAGGASRPRNEVRIIGGRWRGRKIRFPADTAIRPSPDRVRETLFNWLMPAIAGARCLDPFAGSGVLGFEALSRGAGHATFVDRDRRVVEHLESLARELGAATATVVRADAGRWIETAPGPFDLVFLDPPFGSGQLPALLAALAAPGRLAPCAHVYVECPRTEALPALPPGFTVHRSGHAGDVGYHLLLGPRPGEETQ